MKLIFGTMNIDIIGGGVAGCGSALLLADTGHKVTLWEYKDELLTGSSNATPCRLGLFHYPDQETNFKCLNSIIALIKQYPGYKRLDEKEDDYLHSTYYFVVNDSTSAAETVINLFNNIKLEYARKIYEDPSNKVLGEPEALVMPLELSVYENFVDTSKVTLGIKTGECSLNWPKLKENLTKRILNHPNIQVNTRSEIVNAEQSDSNPGFVLTIKNTLTQELSSRETDFIINSSWQNIEKINRQAGFAMLPGTRTNRTKVMIEVLLPESLEKIPSMFFCFGAYCAFTNIGDKKGFITYEPITNIECNTDLEISTFSARLLAGQATEEEKLQYGSKIIFGVSQFIPDMQHAKFVNAYFGNVRTEGAVKSYADGNFDKRCENGVTEQQLLWLSNASMKLTRFSDNAKKICTLVAQHEEVLNNLENTVLPEIKQSINSGSPRTINHYFIKYLQRYILPTGLKHDTLQQLSLQLIKAIKSKERVNIDVLNSISLETLETRKKCHSTF